MSTTGDHTAAAEEAKDEAEDARELEAKKEPVVDI
jgi:hypothetical protein